MADPTGVAFSDDPVMTAEPAWNDISLGYKVAGWSTNRGRSYEFDKTGIGTATIDLIDVDGSFDPTQPGSLTADVLWHAALCLHDPNNADPDVGWSTIYRGYISSVSWSPYQNEQIANVRLELVDAAAIFAAMEMAPDGTFGDSVDDGNIVFQQLDFTDAVQRRIGDGTLYPGILTQAGWPDDLRSIFTCNVWLQKQVFAARTSVWQVLQETVDAEFPGVANLFIGGPRNPGKVVVHGRLARFDFSNPDYEIHQHYLGDDAAADIDSDIVRISPPLEIFRDDSHIYTSAIAIPQDREGVLTNADIAGQYVTDATAVTAFGLRTWSAENLVTGAQDTSGSTTVLQATKLFADYYLANFKQVRTRVGEITVKARNRHTPAGVKAWEFLRDVDIGDVITLSTSHFGYQAFDADQFFVEGIRYKVEPGGQADAAGINEPIVTCTLDVSPASYYSSNPF